MSQEESEGGRLRWWKSVWKSMSATPHGRGRGFGEAELNFSPRAQQTLALARGEADRLHHHFVGTEHLLLGMIRLGQGVGFHVLINELRRAGVVVEAVRAQVENQVGPGPEGTMTGNIPYTPRTKRVLALAAKEARALNHSHVGTEHILLGLLKEGDGVAARVLTGLKVEIEKVRREILRQLQADRTHRAEDVETHESSASATLPENGPGFIDVTKRYDVYCWERERTLVVYRDVVFKGRNTLLSTGKGDFGPEFLTLEHSNGQTVFVSQFSVVKFCEHGTEPGGEDALSG